MFMRNKNGNFRRVQITRFVLAGIFLTAGACHFVFQDEFTTVIPEPLPLKPLINKVIGVLEIVIGLSYYSTVKNLAYKITFILLIIYIWPHLYFIQMGSCNEAISISPSISWVRLLVIHPILLFSTYYLIKHD